MAAIINPYFHQNQTTEQNLINGLIKESIQINGRRYYYLPRNVMNEDPILGEDILSKFGLAIPVEMFMNDTEGFQGDKEMFSKFGLEIKNSYKLVISKDRWEEEVKVYFDNVTSPTNPEADFDVTTNLRPQEGDLIWDPLTSFLMEIKFVDHDVEFFQLGKNYMYHLSCEAFQYSSEQIATGITEIDAFEAALSIDTLNYQLKTETGDMIVQEEVDCGDYILQEFGNISEKPARKVGTDFESFSSDVSFSVLDPFGEL